MRRILIVAGMCVGAAAAVLALGEQPARAEDSVCDGRPLPAVQRATCRAQLEQAWRDAAAVEANLEAEPTVPSVDASTEERKHDAEVRAKRDTARQKQVATAAALVSYRLQDAYDENHCDRLFTLCLDRDGEVVAARPVEAPPAAVRSGDKLIVIVLTKTRDVDRGAIKVQFEARKSLDTQFEAIPSPPKALGDKPKATEPPQVTFEPLPFPSDPVADDAEDLTITFQRTPAKGEIGADKQFVIPIDRGHSYYSVAFLVAATFKGDRRVLRNLGTTSDHAVDPGLALNIFPGGRERGVIGYARRGSSPGRWLANNVGFQLGTDLDLTNPTDKLYAGLVFEPVAGLALVGGVTLRKVAVVPPAGALPALAAMDGSSPSDTRYVTRGYIGITMTLDLLNTISAFGTDLKKIKVP